MKSASAKPKTPEQRSGKLLPEHIPFDAPGYLEHIARGLDEHRSLHEMLLALAESFKESDEDREWQAAALCPGLVVIMDRLSGEGDELIRKVRYVQEQLTEKDRAAEEEAVQTDLNGIVAAERANQAQQRARRGNKKDGAR